MTQTRDTILSASRRTDIPAFYLDWFMDRVRKGFFEVINPYNRITTRVDASPERVHSIVFWSKNFRMFLESGAGHDLKQMGYSLFFNFTVNSRSPVLEPNLPCLDERLDQMGCLCREFGPQTIAWRFDPVCHFRLADGTSGNNLADFSTIALAAGESGISRCITSFADDYPKIRRRLKRLCQGSQDGLSLEFPGVSEKVALLTQMHQTLAPLGIALFSCCEPEVLSGLPGTVPVRPGACISGHHLRELFGGNPVTARDSGQRTRKGCGCTRSWDIGSYDLHPCHHNCLYCYASPAMDRLETEAGI
ncbi:MAG: DUF1848 family protein [Pseudomonadota bacterium]